MRTGAADGFSGVKWKYLTENAKNVNSGGKVQKLWTGGQEMVDREDGERQKWEDCGKMWEMTLPSLPY